MRHTIRVLLEILAIVLLLVSTGGAVQAEGRRMALVIGINVYPNLGDTHQLKTAVNDADMVARTLQSIGFEPPTVVHNATRGQFIDALYDFTAKLTREDTAVFFFAGHGVNFGANYLLPSDIPRARSNSRSEEARLATSAVSEKEIIQTIAASGAKVTFAIFDACRDNPLNVDGDRSRSLGDAGGLHLSVAQPEGVAVLYSAGYGQQALDRLKSDAPDAALNSVFTRVLVRELTKPGQGIRALADTLKVEVAALARGEDGHIQRPAYYDEMSGEFILAPAAPGLTPQPAKPAEAVAVAPVPPQQAAAPPLAASRSIGECQERAGFEEAGVKEVVFDRIDAQAAVAACRAALTERPDDPNLIVMLARALDKAKSYDEARILYERAANLGNARSMSNLGQIYQFGDGVEKDLVKARSLYEKASELGSAAAMYNLGLIYQFGDGVEKDLVKARSLYEKASELGSAAAMSSLGQIYQFGDGVEKDLVKARSLYEKASELGSAAAMISLGQIHQFGDGVEEDLVKARSLYEKASELGSAAAMSNLGKIYQYGVEKDLVKARSLYEKASELGSAAAMSSLGTMYQYGEGVQKDLVKARNFYRQAVEGGDVGSASSLAVLLDTGEGGSADHDGAARYIELSLRHGSEFSSAEMKTNATAWSLEFRKTLQSRLRDAGVYDGKIDGQFGPGTFRAIDAIFGKGE